MQVKVQKLHKIVAPTYFLPASTTKATSMSIKSPGANKDDDAMLWLQAQLRKGKHEADCASHSTDQQAPRDQRLNNDMPLQDPPEPNF